MGDLSEEELLIYFEDPQFEIRGCVISEAG